MRVARLIVPIAHCYPGPSDTTAEVSGGKFWVVRRPMAGAEPEERVGQPAVVQAWRHVSFLHWRFDPGRLQALLPDVLEPDVVDGSAWVAITPFRVDRLEVMGLPVPFSTPFAETNVRTYVRDRDGVEGIWFLSLDVSSALNFLAGRTIAPYFPAAMSVAGDGPVIYRCRRRGGPPARHQIEVDPGAAIGRGAQRALVDRLTGRWRAFARVPSGRLALVPVQHEPWPLQEATLTHLDQSLLRAAGLPEPDADPMVHYSAGVDARIGPPRPVHASTQAPTETISSSASLDLGTERAHAAGN
jgi:uncharacterized protein